MSRISKPVSLSALFAAISLLAGGSAWAQCPMCRQALATQGPHAASMINLAIIVLLFPAVALFSGVYYVAFQNAKRAESEVGQQDVR